MNVVAAAAVTATASGTNNNQIKVAARKTVAFAMAAVKGTGLKMATTMIAASTTVTATMAA